MISIMFLFLIVVSFIGNITITAFKWRTNLYFTHIRRGCHCRKANVNLNDFEVKFQNLIVVGRFADLTPYTEKDSVGLLFLISNLPYFAASSCLFKHNLQLMGIIIGSAGFASLLYHFVQLQHGNREVSSSIVKKFLYTDYILAISAIGIYCYEIFSRVDSHRYQITDFMATFSVAILSLYVLLVSWSEQNNKGLRYIFFHSMWHILSASAVIILALQV